MKYSEPESNKLEFKRELPKNNQIVKTIIGFCNTYGGKLIIGVKDNHEIIGLDENSIEDLKTLVEKKIFEATEPLIIARVYIQTIQTKSLLVIEVPEGMNKPYYIRAEGREKSTYVRLGSHTQHATHEMIQELLWHSKGLAFESLPVHHAVVENLDFEKIKLFFAKSNKHINNELLLEYGIIAYFNAKLYPTNLGLLVFGKNPQKFLSDAIIICSHFIGTSGRETRASLDCDADLITQYTTALNFIVEHLEPSSNPDIPLIVIQEILFNAIVHRNYHSKTPTKIAIYDDKIEFQTQGQFPGPLDINNLQQGISYLRNPKIYKILREMGLVERLGTGFITLFERYQKAGLNTPHIINGENFVKCVLPRTKKSVLETITDDAKILALFIQQHEITVKDVMRLLAISRATAVRRLNSLLLQKKLLRHGQAKGVFYTLPD